MSKEAEILWPAEDVRKLIQCVLNLFQIHILKDLERRTRSGTGSECLLHMNSSLVPKEHSHDKMCGKSCCAPVTTVKEHGYTFLSYRFQKCPNDHIGQLLESVVHPYGLKYILANVAEQAAQVHANVLKKASQDGLPLDKNILKSLREDILRESALRCIIERVHFFRRTSCSIDAKERGLLACAAHCTDEEASFLRNETIADLMYKGFAIEPNFVGEKVRKQVLSDIELIEFDGQLRELNTCSSEISRLRSDRICWLEQSQINASQYKGLATLAKRLSALPYVLNKKVSNLFCQTSTVYQISVFPANGSYHQKHMDSGFTKETDTGRKITVIYCLNDIKRSKDGGNFRIEYQRSETLKKEKALDSPMKKVSLEDAQLSNQDTPTQTLTHIIPPKADSVIFLKSRTIMYEILPVFRKCFFITMWIHGPISLEDSI